MTDYQTYLYSFQLQLLSIQLPSSQPKTLSIQWRKGQKLTRSQPIITRTKLTHLNETLKLCLKLSRNNTGQYLKKYTTLSLMQGNQHDVLEISSSKIDLAEIMMSNRQDIVVSMFPEPIKIVCKLKFEFVTQLKGFRFGSQEIEESDEEVKQVEVVGQSQGHINVQGVQIETSMNVVIEQEKLILRKQVEDLNYLNQKFRTDRQKLILRVRQLEHDFKQKEKHILREMRNVKTFFGQKIKLRQSIYEQEIEKIVFISNQRISQCQQHITKFQDQSDELKNKLKNKQSEVIRLRQQLIKAQGDISELQNANRILQQDRDSKHRNNLDLIQRYQLKIKSIHDQTQRRAEQLSQIRQNERTQLIIIQQQQRTNLITEIKKHQFDITDKSKALGDYERRLRALEQDVEKKNKIIGRVDQMLNIRKDQITTHQFQNVEISHKLESMLSENKSIEQTLNNQMMVAEKERKELAETILKFESLTVTYKLEKENFNDERETFKAAESVYQQEIAMLKDEQKKLELEIEQMHDKELELENKVDIYRRENNDAKDLLDSDSKTILKYQQNLDDLKNLLEERQKLCQLKQREIQDKSKQVDRLHKDLQKIILLKQDLQSQIKKLQTINKTTQQLYNTKIQRQTDHLNQYNDMIKRQHQLQLELQRTKSDIMHKENQVSKLQRRNGELTAKLKMKKRDGSEQSGDSFIFKSNMSASISPKQGNKITAIEYAHVKAQMELYKKQAEKKDQLLQQQNVLILEKNSKIDELQERLSKDVVESRLREEKMVEKEMLLEYSKKTEKVNRMLNRYEERVDGMIKEVFEIIEATGGTSKSKSIVNKLSTDFDNLQLQITQIKQQNQKINTNMSRSKKDSFGRGTSFSFVNSDNNKLELQIEELQAEIKEKNQQIKQLHQQIDQLKRNFRARSESDIDDDYNNVRRNRSRTKHEKEERETFGPRRVNDDYEDGIERVKRDRVEKQHAMKESQMLKSSQIMDIRIQTLNNELKMKINKEQQLTNELKQRIIMCKQLQQDNRILKSQNFTIQQQSRKLHHSFQALQRDHNQLQRTRDFQSKTTSSTEIQLLTRQNNDLKQRQTRLRNQLQRTKEQYKDKYIRYSQHKDIISELDRGLKDKGKELESVRREVNEVMQLKNKLELWGKGMEVELEECKKKLGKMVDSQTVVVEDKEGEIKGLRRKIITFERLQQELEGKIESLQEKVKTVTSQAQRTVQQFNRKNINQLKEINLLKEQQEVLTQESKVIRRRNQQLSKVNNENQEKSVLSGKVNQEQKRKIQKQVKQLQTKDEQIQRSRYQLRKLSDQIKRMQSSIQSSLKQRKDLQQDNIKLTKTIDSLSTQIRKLTKQLQRTKNQITQTQTDSVSHTKTVKLQAEKLSQQKRRLEKLIEQQQQEIKSLVLKLKKTEDESAEQISTNARVYGEKMSAALSQIEMIRKAVKEAEMEIADYQVENRDLSQEIERLSGKVGGLDGERQGLVLNLETVMDENERKKEEIDKLKKEKFDLELKNTRSLSEAHNSQQQSTKLHEKLHKISQTNKTLIDSLQTLQSQNRSIKIQYTQLMTQYSNAQPFQSRYKHLQKQHKQLLSLNEQLSTELRHKHECVYTKTDLQNYEQTLKGRYEKEMELERNKVSREIGMSYESKQEHVEVQIVELLNQNTGLREELERVREEREGLRGDVGEMGQWRKRAEELGRQVKENQQVITQLQKQLTTLISTTKQSSTNHSTLALQVTQLTASLTSLQSSNTQLQQSKSYLYSQVTKLQISLQKQKEHSEDLNNKYLLLEFENARLKENEIFEKAAYEKRIQQLIQNQQDNLRSAEDNYIDKIHVYNNEMDKLKNILGELKYLVQQKSNTIDELNNQYDMLENELIIVKQEYQNFKLRSNEEKEIASLELFKMTTKMRESEDQSTLKFRRMQEELNRISQQLITASNNANNNNGNSYGSNNKFNNSRISERDEDRTTKKYEEKIKLKDKTIEELKLQNMNLQADMFRMQEQRQFQGSTQVILQLRSQISRLKLQLQNSQIHYDSSNPSTQISQLHQQISSLKKKLAKVKASEQSLTQQLQDIKLKYDSLSAEMIYYKGLESANKELKLKYQQICDELRGSRLERSTTSDVQGQIEMLQSQKEELERRVDQMQGIIVRLGGGFREGEGKRMVKSSFSIH